MYVSVSVKVSERKRGVSVVFITVLYSYEKQNADHVGSTRFCPTVFGNVKGPKC